MKAEAVTCCVRCVIEPCIAFSVCDYTVPSQSVSNFNIKAIKSSFYSQQRGILRDELPFRYEEGISPQRESKIRSQMTDRGRVTFSKYRCSEHNSFEPRRLHKDAYKSLILLSHSFPC